MRFGLTKEHFVFFHKHKHLELEELMTKKEIDAILDATANYNAWKTSGHLKNIILSSPLGELASHFSKTLTLRIAYDRIITDPTPFEGLNLIETSAIRPIASGVLIQLDSYDGENPLIPKQKGSGTFVAPYLPLTFPERCHLLLIAYTTSKAFYVHEPRDPNCHALKKEDYAFNDRLRSETHPIVYTR